MKRYLFVLFLGFSVAVMAQNGDYFLTQHNPPPDQIDNTNFSIEQDQNGIMWIANRKGVLQYDGVHWQLIPTPSALFTLLLDNNNVIYGAGRNLIGRISYDETNQLKFTVLANSPSLDDIISMALFNDEIIFLSSNKIFRYDQAEDTVSLIVENKNLNFQDVFNFEGDLLVTTEDSGLYKLTDDLTEITSQVLFDSLSIDPGIRWINQYTDSTGTRTLLIDGNDRIHIYANDSVHTLEFDDDGYLGSSVPIEGQWVTGNLLAISTLAGGVVFIDPEKSTIDEIINYHTGLPDNQVYAMTVDFDQGVWVAHDYGFTRIAPLMPFKSYGNFPGLDGNILAVAKYENTIFVGTNLGVYYLEEVKDYQEVEYYVRSQVSSVSEANAGTSQPEPKTAAQPEDDQKERKGLFSFLRRKDKNDEDQEEETVTANAEPDDQAGEAQEEPQKKKGFFSRLFGKSNEPENITQTEWERRTKKELLSIRYRFKKIEEIPAKTDLLISTEDFLITGGLSGIYEINKDQTTQISDIPIRTAYYSDRNHILFASTYDNNILSYSRESGSWEPADLLEGLEDYIFQITEQENNIWLISADSLYRIEFDLGSLVDVDVFQVSNPYFEETYAVNHQGSLFFVNSSGYYYYDAEERKIVEAEGLREVWGPAERIFVGGGKNIWMYNGKEWNTLGEQSFDHSNYDFLNVFPEIRQLYYSEEEDKFWVVTAQNKIYEIKPPNDDAIASRQSIYLKEIRQQNDVLLPQPQLNIQLENSSLTFNFIQPDYSGLLGIEYQYQLEGLSDTWSEWGSNNNLVTFSYLPAGDYTLKFQTRDVFGHIKSFDNPIQFRVVDPYWRRPWFYAIEVAFFSVLLFLSIQLNRKNTRYRIVSRLLAFLTLILIIEFIQTVAEYKFETHTSPVIDFFIQVSIAMMVLPLEGLLRKAIFKSKSIELFGKSKKKKEAKKAAT